MSENYKKCSHCDRVLSFQEFSKNSGRGGDQYGLSYWCKKCISDLSKEKQYDKKRNGKRTKYNKDYRQKNIIKLKEKDKINGKKNLKIKLKQRAIRRKNDESYRIKENLRNGLRRAFSLYSKNGKIMKSCVYGVDYEAIIKSLGQKHNETDSIDHIIPCKLFNHDDPMQVWMCWHPDNFQWMDLNTNKSKNDGYDIQKFNEYVKEKKEEYCFNMSNFLKTTKIHMGCGNIYLDNYINVDASPTHYSFLVNPEILNEHRTIFDNYYKFNFGEAPNRIIVDIKANINNLPFPDNFSEEIVLFHVLEHIPFYEVGHLLNEFVRVLKPNGILKIAVPDTKETAKKLAEAKSEEDEEWYVRLLYGTQKNKFFHHFCGYTQRTLKNLLLEYGFDNFEEMPNINFYPAIHIKAQLIKK